MNDDDKKLKDQIVFDAHPKLSEEFSRKTLDKLYFLLSHKYFAIKNIFSALRG